MGDIYTITAIITATTIRIEMESLLGKVEEVAREIRPESLEKADEMLAFHGFRRVRDWDLGPDADLRARVQFVRNQFGGTRAARVWDQMEDREIFHEMEFMGIGLYDQELSVQEGDIIYPDREAPYVVAGWDWALGVTRLILVGDGNTWDERFSVEYPQGAPMWVYRRKR